MVNVIPGTLYRQTDVAMSGFRFACREISIVVYCDQGDFFGQDGLERCDEVE